MSVSTDSLQNLDKNEYAPIHDVDKALKRERKEKIKLTRVAQYVVTVDKVSNTLIKDSEYAKKLP